MIAEAEALQAAQAGQAERALQEYDGAKAAVEAAMAAEAELVNTYRAMKDKKAKAQQVRPRP